MHRWVCALEQTLAAARQQEADDIDIVKCLKAKSVSHKEACVRLLGWHDAGTGAWMWSENATARYSTAQRQEGCIHALGA